MMLIEQTGVPTAALPVQEFKDHLRLGTGFADDTVQDALVEAYLRAALAAIEGRIGKALLARDFLMTLTAWRDDAAHAFSVAPVSTILSVDVLDRDDVATLIAPTRYKLLRDMHRPKIVASTGILPGIPTGGSVEISFTAGFGATWADVPVDLRQAVFLLAAQFHENRHEAADQRTTMPFGVIALIERWRTVRVLGGGAA
jgi:uncharacterized phiE125 gp8 family phage protein